MSKRTFLNLRTNYGVETVDFVERNDYPNLTAYKQEVKRLRNEYQLAGMQVYSSNRACKEWYEQHSH